MFRNQYDSDVTVWSPQGRLHQVEYAVEAMKQGSATVGIKSETHAVIVALKRAQNELCSHQKKIYEIDTHSGVSIAGLLSDGRILARFLQTECSSWRWDYKLPIPMKKLAEAMQLKLQANTQYYGRRPFGVGLLVAGYDKDGAHIIQTDPSAEVVSMLGTSIGSRSQSARTYLERHVDEFEKSTPEQLIVHALLALRDTLPAEENLSAQNTSIGIVGKDMPFKIIEDELVQTHLDQVATHPRNITAPGSGAAPAAGRQSPAPGGAGAPEPMQQ
ncbi:unnamed protein product [Caenorhabditis angaria]|uniref:Proteasome subunit alpha type n=1 Tax=Caenorhabditis angaria TaxID=860376 RepID=A0A9P1N6T0_9PELO|nr:unnamed protein product [Caenorhabditis angaria]